MWALPAPKKQCLGFVCLSAIIISCLVNVLTNEKGTTAWLLGTAVGLLFGVLHVPDTGTVRNVPRALKLFFAAFVLVLSAYVATIPWHHLHLFSSPLRRTMHDRWIMLTSISTCAVVPWWHRAHCHARFQVFTLCILEKHPPSSYAHDARLQLTIR